MFLVSHSKNYRG